MLSKNQLKNISSLHHKKYREEQKLFIVEGEKLLDELLNSAFEINHIYATKNWIDKQTKIPNKINVTEINENELNKISLLPTPNKVLAIVNQKSFNLNTSVFNDHLSIYLDDIRDPGNLGTIIRLAHWFGINQIICSPNTVETFNPKVVQSTMGSIFHVPVIKQELSDVLFSLSKPINVYGAFLDGENIYTKTRFNSGILVIGNESNGISEVNFPHITEKISIPSNSPHSSESLNAAMALGIIVSEHFRRVKYGV
jgi:TrmH family RNA methyltransferase